MRNRKQVTHKRQCPPDYTRFIPKRLSLHVELCRNSFALIHFLLLYIYIYIYIYIGFKTFFYIVLHLDSTASYLPTGLHLGFFRSWPSLYLPSSISSVLLVLSFVLASISMLFFGSLPSAILWTWPYHVSWFCSIMFIIVSSNQICCLIVTFLILSFLDIL